MPFAVNGACRRCSRPFRLTLDASPAADTHCASCGEQIVRWIPGYIYVLSNTEMPGLLKIGQTTRAVADRVAELNAATGVPCPFFVEAWFESSDPLSHEAEIHKLLSAGRLPNREFFRVSISEATRAARTVTGSDSNGSVTKEFRPPDLLPPSQSAYRPSIFKQWQCTKCSRKFRAIEQKGICCGQQAKRIS
jgi:T5orf172 domain